MLKQNIVYQNSLFCHAEPQFHMHADSTIVHFNNNMYVQVAIRHYKCILWEGFINSNCRNQVLCWLSFMQIDIETVNR